ncbi:MAG: SDR family NAD(P)-dependent oxidoreductase [Gemmatimonadetes bacterium]|nr:SDR family NAD(P)-dependent oxidoreductase [Gemmatimonadota bacterium]
MTKLIGEQTVLVTGANAGIGRATATELARRGARVLMACRDGARGTEARAALMADVPGARTELLVADLSSGAGVRSLAAQTLQHTDRLDVLVNNAGVFTRKYTPTAAGLETQFAVNHLAPFLLTNLLRDLLVKSAPARVVTVSSEAHKRGQIRFDDLQGAQNYSGMKAYSQSKLANLLFNRELARRFGGTGVTANALHPGVIATQLLLTGFAPIRLLRPFLKTPDAGARTSVFLAVAPAVERLTGLYFVDFEPARPSQAARDDGAARRLWRISAELSGMNPEENS